MFESYTYDALLSDVLENAPDGIDTRQGSIFYDAVAGILLKVAKLYTDLDIVLDLSTLSTTTGEALDAKASEYGITRLSATAAKYYALFEGTTPDVGERFYYDGLYFMLCCTSDGTYYFEAETASESCNYIESGTIAVPVNNITGLTSATFGDIYENGTDEEDDESLRSRVQEKIAGPAENGNKQHYKTWCESIDGIGRARIMPLWNGPNTVKAVLIDATGQAVSDDKVDEVQEYIDPATNGYTTTVGGKTYVVGDGLGEGVANLGAHFTAIAADEEDISVSFTVETASGYDSYTADDIAAEAELAITDYLSDLTLNTDDTITVRITAIGAIILELDCVADYSDLTINGGTVNITLDDEAIPVLSSIDVTL